MWTTIETFRESLSQITSEVLDAAEELDPGGSAQPPSSDGTGSDTSSHHPRRQLPRLNHAERNGKENHASPGGRSSNGFLPKMKELQALNTSLQAKEKELLSQLSEKSRACTSLQEVNGKVMAELTALKEAFQKEREECLNTKAQLQRERKLAEELNRDNKRMKSEKQKMSLEISELQHRLTDQLADANTVRDDSRSEVVKEMERTLFMKNEKAEQLQALVKDLEKENHHLQAEVKRLMQSMTPRQKSLSAEEGLEVGLAKKNLVEANGFPTPEVNHLKAEEDMFELERRELNKMFDAVCAERDRAIRDLNRLKQHLLEIELADSEKMEQDSKHIAELEAKADASTMRAMRLEQTLGQTLAKQVEITKKQSDQLEEAYQEIASLKKKVAGFESALESKDGELLNLQGALGQYYAESEAKERLHLELSMTRKELGMLSDQLKAANDALALRCREKEELLEKLALQQKKVAESQEQSHKLEADALMLRRALEQSLTRLNRMSSDSDYYVDRRIVIKLLVTYFQRQQNKEVLDLMSRMLGFAEEDKQAIGLAQRTAGKGVVRGVLGLPGRVVGGLLKTSSSSSLPALSDPDNQSFSDLWIDFLLKESEERERRDALASNEETTTNKSLSTSDDSQPEAFSTPKPSRALENGSVLTINDDGSEFSNVPLNSTPSPSLVRKFMPSRS